MTKIPRYGTILGALLAAVALGTGQPARAFPPQRSAAAALAQAPLTEKQVVDLIKHNKKDLAKIEPTLQAQGVDFEVTPDIEKNLHKAGATDELVEAIKKLGPAARAAAQHAQAAGSSVSPEESNEFQAIENELDPDHAIQLATDFEKKYPQSQLLTFVYSFEANAYQQKNDPEHTVQYGEKSLQLKPDNLLSLLIVSAILPTPQIVRDLSDADKLKKLDEAEQDANRALQIIGQLPKQPSETDEAYQKRKAAVSSGAYSSLGMVHLERSEMGLQGPDKDELAKAEQDYTAAVQDSPSPNAADCYRLGEVYSTEGKLDEAIAAYTKAGNAAQGSQIQSMAQQQIDSLKKRKAASGPPTKP